MRETPYSAALHRVKRSFVLVALFSAAVNILMLTGPMFMLQVYDRVLASGSVATLQGLFVIVVVLYFFLGLYDFLRTRLLSRAAYRLDATIGPDVYEVWVRSGIDGKQGTRRPVNDLSVVRSFIPSPAMLGLFDTPWIPFYLFIVFYIHPWLGYLAIFGAGVVVVLALLNQWGTKVSFSRAIAMDGAESFFVEQTRRNAEAIVPLGMTGRIRDRWAKMHADGLATGQIGGDRSEGYSASSKAFRLLLQSSLLALGGYLVLKQEISPGMIVAASIIAGRALAPIDQVIGQWRGILRAREAHQRLHELFRDQTTRRPTIDLPDPGGHLSVSGLTKFPPGKARQSDQKPILDNVTFALASGDAVGVIGPSASGKSTLARLLVGAWLPDGGEIRLDGATLDQWSDAALGRHIGYLPQHLEMLAGSIRDNIARFDPQADDNAVIEAAQTAGVHEMILMLPDGYATQLGYGAHPLSGGQVQRLGLARAIYGNPRYIVLDEPNSNLDAQGDEALSRAIMKMRQAGSTVVVMAHRPSAIAAVNKVLVLHGGRVAEFGDREATLSKATRQGARKLVEGAQ